MQIIVRQLAIVVGVSLLLITHPATADPWYEHYAEAEQALEKAQELRKKNLLRFPGTGFQGR